MSESPDLRRHVGPVGLLFASTGSIIGSGWLFGAFNASSQAGPAAVISWVLGAALILLIALCYAELGTMFPLSGGVVRFPQLAFGGLSSFVTGWTTYVALATSAPLEVAAALQYGTRYADFTTRQVVDGQTVYTLTALGYGTAVALMALFVVVNYCGVRWFARLNNALVGWKLATVVVVVVALLLTAFHGENFTSQGFAPAGAHGVVTAVATSGIVFSFLGFQQGIQLAGETDDPRRNVPLAVIGSVLLTAVLYVGLQVAFIGAVDDRFIADGWSRLSLGENGSLDFGPLAQLASALGLAWLAVLLYVDAVVSPGDTALISLTVTSRISFAMARNGNAPRALARTTSSGVPLVGLVTAFVIGLFVFLPFPSWQQLVGFVSSATVLSFASGPLVLSALRSQTPDAARPFRVPGGHVIPVLAFWGANLVVYWSGWTTVWKLMVAVLLGLVLLGAAVATGHGPGRSLDLRAGLWGLPWLGGLTLISYFGSYPEPAAGNLGLLSFEASLGLLLALSVAVHAMAFRLRLTPARVRAYIQETLYEVR